MCLSVCRLNARCWRDLAGTEGHVGFAGARGERGYKGMPGQTGPNGHMGFQGQVCEAQVVLESIND